MRHRAFPLPPSQRRGVFLFAGFAGRAAGRCSLGAVLALFLSSVLPLAAASLTATVDRSVVPLGENLTLSLIFEGGAPGANPSLPALPGFNVAPGISQRSEFSFVNGQQSSRQIYEYTLVPTQAGDFTIPALQIRVGNQVLTSAPLRVRVAPGAAAAPAADPTTNLAFVRLIVPKSEVFVGEPIPIEIHLYFRVDARDLQRPEIKGEGFSFGQLAEPVQTSTAINGVGYRLIIFKMAATAARAGSFNLGPAQCGLTLLIPPARGRRDPFDPFGFFGPQPQARPVTLASQPHPMRVLPLPVENVPPTFNGAVGNFQLNVTAAPTNLAVGDPLTVKIRIAGNGLVDTLTLPEQPAWRDFKTYTPTASTESRDPLGLSGAKNFTQVVIPLNHELTALPPAQFSFFDPNARAYRTLTGPAIPLQVRASASVAPPPPALATNEAPPPPLVVDDIIPIKTRLDRRGSPAPLLALQPWFLGLQSVPLLAWLALLLWRRRAEMLANNPRLRRQREVVQRIRAGVKELHDHAAARNAAGFFATLFHLLQEQLGERLDLPASAITEAVIDEHLRPRGVPAPTLDALHDLFQTCNAARYAPAHTAQELAALIPRLETVLRELQQMKP